MKRLLLVLMMLFIPLTACGSDPEKEDLEQYVQVDLFNLRTNLRASKSNYDKTRSLNELASTKLLRTKVISQLTRYQQGLKEVKTKTAFVERLNDTGIERTGKAIELIDNYAKVTLKRNANMTMRARADADLAFQKVEDWQKEVWEEAHARGISVPSDNVR